LPDRPQGLICFTSKLLFENCTEEKCEATSMIEEILMI